MIGRKSLLTSTMLQLPDKIEPQHAAQPSVLQTRMRFRILHIGVTCRCLVLAAAVLHEVVGFDKQRKHLVHLRKAF